MIILGTYPPARVLVVLLLGQLILLGGVIVLSKAGFMKNGNNEGTKTAKEKGTSSLFITGLIMRLPPAPVQQPLISAPQQPIIRLPWL